MSSQLLFPGYMTPSLVFFEAMFALSVLIGNNVFRALITCKGMFGSTILRKHGMTLELRAVLAARLEPSDTLSRRQRVVISSKLLHELRVLSSFSVL